MFRSVVNLRSKQEVLRDKTITLYQPLARKDLQSFKTTSPNKRLHFRIRRVASIRFRKLIFLLYALIEKKITLKRFLVRIALLELNEVLKQTPEFNGTGIHRIFFYNEKQYWEGLWCLALQIKKFNTVSIAHGFYRDTGRACTLKNTNPNNYRYQIAQTQVCWGAIQKEIMSKYDTSNTNYRIIGKENLIVEPRDVKKIGARTKNIIILDSQELRSLNKELLSDTRNIQLKFYVKPHPDDMYDYGYPIVDDLEEILEDVEAFWGNNSSALLQIGRSGYPVFLYKKSDFLKYIDASYYKKLGDYYKINESYNWKDFINLVGYDYLEALEACQV